MHARRRKRHVRWPQMEEDSHLQITDLRMNLRLLRLKRVSRDIENRLSIILWESPLGNLNPFEVGNGEGMKMEETEETEENTEAKKETKKAPLYGKTSFHIFSD